MADYAFQLEAQQWRTDPYYVASGRPIKHLTVVATSEDLAIEEAKKVLGEPERGYYWRFVTRDIKDARLS